MLSSLEKAVFEDLIIEATHEVLDDDEVDFTLDVWEGKNDLDEEEYTNG